MSRPKSMNDEPTIQKEVTSAAVLYHVVEKPMSQALPLGLGSIIPTEIETLSAPMPQRSDRRKKKQCARQDEESSQHDPNAKASCRRKFGQDENRKTDA